MRDPRPVHHTHADRPCAASGDLGTDFNAGTKPFAIVAPIMLPSSPNTGARNGPRESRYTHARSRVVADSAVYVTAKQRRICVEQGSYFCKWHAGACSLQKPFGSIF